MKQNILVIDDDKNIREVVKLYLRKEGYEITEAADGKLGADLFFGKQYDLVLLDIMMPVQDGIETMKQIRAKSNVPVIMLTAKGETFDKVLALELGADDYIVKPFDPKELVARVKAVIRRSTQEDKSDILEYPNLKIDMQNYQVIYEGKEVQMPPKMCIRDSLSKIFKEETQKSISAYINYVRIENAKKLLTTTDISLVDLAYIVGFEEQSYFTKVFKKLEGIAPGKYRDSTARLIP